MNSLLSQLKGKVAGNQVAAIDSSSAITYSELMQVCSALADKLNRLQIRKLALQADNSISWIIVDLACQQASVCLIPLPTFFSQQQVKHALEITPVDAILCEQASRFTLFSSEKHSSEKLLFLGGYQLLVLNSKKAETRLPNNTNKITFTSGSTGTPKGVCLSNDQLILQASALAEAVNLTNPRHLCLLPLSILLENVAGIYATLLAGGEIIMPSLGEIGFEGSSSLNPRQFINAISHYSPNSIITTPQLLQVMIGAAEKGWICPSSLQFVAVGGARVSDKLLRQAQTHNIPVYEGYGLSECASVVSLNTPNDNDQHTSGRPLPHLTVEIEKGEVVVTGNAMLGYAGEPDSWYPNKIYTGDMGSLTEQGYLSINGRKKNLLISSFGRNINPEWIESELLAQLPISECIVLGDSRPYCVALIRVSDSNQQEANIQHLINKTNAKLPDYARIQNWYAIAEPLVSHQHLMTDNGRPIRQAISVHYAEVIESLYQQNLKVETL